MSFAFCQYSWNQDRNDIRLYFFQHFFFIGIKIVVLGRDYYGVNSQRLILIIVFYGHLRFCIRTQIGNRIVFSSQGCKFD